MMQEKASELITENGRDLHGLCRCFALNNINGSVYHPQMKSVFCRMHDEILFSTICFILNRLQHLFDVIQLSFNVICLIFQCIQLRF